jgi:hypothetical protein
MDPCKNNFYFVRHSSEDEDDDRKQVRLRI